LFTMLCTLGVSAAQQVTLSSTSLNFGSVSAGNFSGTQTITLSNSGSADLTVSSIAASGGFAQTNNCSTLHAGQSCTVEVTDISAIVGTTKGVLTISDNAASSPQIVSLTGKTLAPIVLAPSNLNFGNVAVGASATKSLTVTNTGVSFGIAAISASGDYAQTNNCPTTLATGKTCTISVTFRPRTNGTRAGVVAITSQDGGFVAPPAAFTAALSGTGTGGSTTSQVSVQPASLSFGVKTPVDILQSSLTLKVTNSSASSSLTVQGVSAVGPIYNQVPFYQIGSTNCVGMLAPGAQCTIQVVQNPPTTAFSPASAAGSVVIVDSDSTGPSVIPVSASILPEAQFTPASINFPPQAVGTTSAATVVTVSSNIDETGLSLIPLAVSGDFNIVSAGKNPCGLSPGFGPGVSCTLGVTFTPHQAGPVNGAISLTAYPECQPQQVIIEHQPCEVSQVITLSGTGK
jgi:hypothetical protein